MSKTLSQIFSDGTLVDNTIHQAKEGFFYADRSKEPIEIYCGRGTNHPKVVWPLLNSAATLNTEEAELVFRMPEADYEHNTDDPFIRLTGTNPNPLDFTLVTGNLIGCVKAEGYTLRISSRFGNDFLRYIIADADGFVELPEHGGIDEGDYDWLLIYLWLIRLKKAFRLGLPKTYETRVESLAQVHGRLDPVDYFLNQERAHYKCTYREHSYDNDTTRLIARTLQHLDSHDFLREAHTLNQTFQIATLGRRNSLQDLLAARPVQNPFYADYNPVIVLSKQILRNELSDFGNRTQTSAFFFDVSMLFEYFVRKLLKRAGVLFRNKTSRDWTIPSGRLNRSPRLLIPDLVFDIGGATYVFDVKYKSFNFDDGVHRDDLFQLHTYVGQISNQCHVAGCGFIYPIRESRWCAKELGYTGGILTDSFDQAGRDIPFHVAFLCIPENQSSGPSAFQSRFRSNCKAFTDEFLKRLAVTPV